MKKIRPQIIAVLIFISTVILYITFSEDSPTVNTEEVIDTNGFVLEGTILEASDYIKMYPWINDVYQEKMEALTTTQAKDIQLLDIDGEKSNLSDYKGNDVLIAFVASWCGPCNEMLPVFSEYNKLDGFPELIMVAPFDTEDDYEQFAIAANALGVKTYIPENFNQEDFMVSSVPHVTYIDKDGIIQVIDGGQLDVDTLADYAKTSFNK